jgi:DNA polymerase III psi subunit
MDQPKSFGLSDAHKAILSQMGITYWQSKASENPLVHSDPVTHQAATSSSKRVLTFADSLADQSIELTQFFSDIQGCLVDWQLIDIADSVNTEHTLVWQKGDSFQFDGKILSTPPLSELVDPVNKKTLWRYLQQVMHAGA